MTLLGPADADHFRVKVGQNRERFYCDPLPGALDDTGQMWKATDAVWPSVSKVKPPFANKYVVISSIAHMPTDDWRLLSGKNTDDRYEDLKKYEKRAGNINKDRGSLVHKRAEELLLGREPDPFRNPRYSEAAYEQAERFYPALEAFFDAYQPEPIAVEAVCIHRELNGRGFGGTADTFARVDGDLWVVDWKSRNSDHAIYETDVAQGGAYLGAHYMIVQGDDGNPVRMAVPECAGVLIVSIREDGYRCYPVPAADAIDYFDCMHAWWVAQRSLVEAKVFGKAWPPRAAPGGNAASVVDSREVSQGATGAGADGMVLPSAPPPTNRREQLLARYRALSDDDKRRFNDISNPGLAPDLDAIEAALDQVEPFNNVAMPDVSPLIDVVPVTPITPPDDGPNIDGALYSDMQLRVLELTAVQAAWVQQIVREANSSPYGSISLRVLPSRRRWEIARALVSWCEACAPSRPDDDLFRAALTISSAVNPVEVGLPLGEMVARLSIPEAQKLADIAQDIISEVLTVESTEPGVWAFVPAENNKQLSLEEIKASVE